MSKFNTPNVRAAVSGPLVTTGETTLGHKGATAFVSDEKSELFLLAISDFVEDTFYESASARLDRIRNLVRVVVASDHKWLLRFVPWLRNEANMRSVSLVIALEGADAMLKNDIPGGRALVRSAMSRADEPGEALAYWFANKGRKLPSAVKRGISDAVTDLYNEYSISKYNSSSAGFSLSDVVKLTHPKPKNTEQDDLFEYVIERQFDSNTPVPDSLVKTGIRQDVMSLDKEKLRELLRSEKGAGVLKSAGLTWEAVAGKAGLDAQIWESLIPNMGYMALLRNLRNFEKEGVSDAVLNQVAARLSDPNEVAKSRQLPFRFLSAYNAVSGMESDYFGRRIPNPAGSLRFVYPLEQALNHSMSNVPSLKGKTLILVDRSGSMFGTAGKNGLNLADSAAIFGAALAIRSEDATLVQYGTSDEKVDFTSRSSVLKVLESFRSMGGTDTLGTLDKYYNTSYDRVVILTDEQHDPYFSPRGYYGGRSTQSSDSIVDKDTPLYVFNLAGYRGRQMESKPNRYTFGGLSDQSFKVLSLIEQGRDGTWPWEV